MKLLRTWKEMKNGTATVEPQSPAACVHVPLSSCCIASAMMLDQSSPVMHWKRTRKAELNVSRLRKLVMPPCTPW